MNDTVSSVLCSNKKLSQTRISNFFPGCIKMVPPITKSPRKRKTVSGGCKRLSLSSSGIAKCLNLSAEDIAVISGIPKRTLPDPFSSDEDSENEHANAKSPKAARGNDGEKKQLSITPKTALKASSRPKTEPEASPSNTPKVRVLQDIAIASTKPNQTPIKNEKKKVNYEPIKVMQEFFRNICETEHLLNLLSKSDTEFLSKFFEMEQNHQLVCIKLFLWRPIWYNFNDFVEKIGLSMNHSESAAMYHFLKDKGFVKTDYVNDDLMALLNNLLLKDVKSIAKSFKFRDITGTKENIISRLLKHSRMQGTLTAMNSESVLRKRIKEKMGFCVKLSDQLNKCLYYIYVLSTFTNPTLTDPQDYFTNVGYLKIVFPPYDVENYSVFGTPEDFCRFAEALKLRSELHKAVEKKNHDEILQICTHAFEKLQEINEEFGDSFDGTRPPHLERFTPNAQYVQILSKGSHPITTHYYEDVISWFKYLVSQGYCRYKRGDWYAHMIHMYTRYVKDHEKAANLLIQVLKTEDNLSEVQLQELAHRGKMLNRKTYKLPVLYRDEIASLSPPFCDREWPQDFVECKSIKSDDPGGRRKYVHPSDNGDVSYLNVEETALKHYRSAGFPNGRHCEGRMIIAAFSLLFWDIIYDSKIEGTFVSNVQSVPLDMYTPHFYTNREHRIIKRLDNIKQNWSDAALKKVMESNWDLHSHETALCLMESVADGPEMLFNVVMSIGRDVVAKIFERVARNFKEYHSGFPDLIVWSLEDKKVKFVEVKSETDKLSLKQKLWLNYLMDIGVPIAVCHVESKASKKPKNKKKQCDDEDPDK